MKTLLVLLLSAATCLLHAQTADFDKLVAENFPADGPAGSVSVVKNGKTIYEKAVGYADLENKVPARTDHVFRIGSITKQFTAVAILQLAKDGKLALSDEITKFIPDYPTQGKKITVEHLLNHTSGIKSYTGMEKWTPEVQRKDFTPMELVDFFKNEPMEFDPGVKWNYNNSGYILLGVIIEKVSGMSYADYVQKNLFEPASMKLSYYDMPLPIIPNRARGYDQMDDGGYANCEYLSMTQPYSAGSLASTTGDLCKWTAALHSGKLLDKTWLNKAFQPTILPDGTNTQYGFGWQMFNLQGAPTIEHGGGIYGFLSMMIYLPKEDVCVAALSANTGNPPEDLTAKLAAVAIGKPYEAPAVKVAEKDLQQYSGIFENAKGDLRVISVEKGRLQSRRIGGGTFFLIPNGDDKFSFEKSLTTLRFVKEKGKISELVLTDRSQGESIWKKSDKPIPEGPKEAKLSTAQMDQLLGNYELAPGFILTFTRKENQMFVQATGQPAFEIYPESETKFFLKVVPASCEFVLDGSGVAKELLWNQGGETTPAKKL